MSSAFLRFLMATAVILAIWTGTMAQSIAFDTSRMDRSVSACDDFFEFANGNWIKNTPIPPSQSRWGSFNTLAEGNREVLHGILERAAADKNAKGDEKLIGDFYASCMDEAAIEKAGAHPLDKVYAQIDSMKSVDDLRHEIARLHSEGFPAVFRFGGGPDQKNSNMVILNAGQGGLSLGNRDYYTSDNPRMVETRARFIQHVTNMFKLLGESPDAAAADASTVMAIQMRLANASMTPEQLRNRDKNYNKISIADAEAIVPNLSLASYLKERNLPTNVDIDFQQPGFFKEVNTMVTDVPLAQWKSYLRWMVLSSSANALSKPFVDENFDFQGRFMTGVKEQQERWKRCTEATDRTLGESLGAEYIKTQFTPAQEKAANDMLDHIFAAMKNRIMNLAWMSAETKQKALAKLATYQRKIGYNRHPRGYEGLKVDRSAYAENVRRSSEFQTARNAQDVGKPTDKTRWGLTPPTVNAYYNASSNEIVFPAGILQPPFFNFKADDAINYGGMGAVIGHEISHGFDDQGSKYDAEGNQKNWWTPEDRKAFDERAQCVIDQFSGYEILPGVFIKGQRTIGENIGDLGGLNVAYTALMDDLKTNPAPGLIDGFTPQQRFFLGWAQVWAAKSTPEAERQQVETDSHSAARYRVDGPLSNMPEFAQAFGCKQGDKMVRTKSCVIW
ncbi:MAG: M13 family metallopeptidase [Pyrinomonadaceae bacterium]